MLLHITTAEAWREAVAAGRHAPPSLAAEGFVHCSLPEQVAATANRFFPGERGLILLVIDEARLGAPVRYENLEGGAEPFPHVYGAIEPAAVVGVVPYEPDASGRFGDPRLPG